MASEFTPNRIKTVCDIYGEENILGFIIDSNSRFMIMPGQVFSYAQNVDEASDCLKMEVPNTGIGFQSSTRAKTLFVYIPIMMIHSVMIKTEKGSDKQYDIFTLSL